MVRSLRRAAALLGLVGAVALGAAFAAPSPAPTKIVVYKSPSCGCCKAWMEHLTASGFAVEAHDVDDVAPYKADMGIPGRLHSCHTAIVAGYAVEGHVPAREIHRLLKEKPKVAGLAVPGMPMGSPGMEGPRKDPYEVLTFDARGATSVYAKY